MLLIINYFIKLYGTVFLLGALNVLGFSPYGWYLIPLLSITGLFSLWRYNPAYSASLGYVFGLGFFATGVSWIYISLHTYGAMPALLAGTATFLFVAFLALFPAFAGYLYQRHLTTQVWGIAAIWMLQEWIRGWIFTGFPWLAIGYSQVPASPLTGYAPIMGVFGISLLLAWTAANLALRPAAWMWVIALIWAAGSALSHIVWTQPLGASFSVTLIQGNISQAIKWEPGHRADTLRIYHKLAAASHARLTILPETAIPIFYDEVPVAYLQDLIRDGRNNGGDVLVGVPEETTGDNYYNSVMSFGLAPTQVYRKFHLVPFGEYIPLRPVFGWILDVLKMPLSDFSRGSQHQQPFQIAGQRVAADVCYEDVFGDEIIHQLPAASILVNVTDDAWFGDTVAPWQHLQIAQMRALETGREMLRATNTGVTAIIERNGTVQQYLPLFKRAVLSGSAQGYRGDTPFIRWGNTLALLLAVIFLVVEFFSRRSQIKTSSAASIK